MIIHNFEIFHCTFGMVGSIQIINLLTYLALCIIMCLVSAVRCVCLVITPTEANCTSKWLRYWHHAASGTKKQHRTNTLEDCQKACEFGPRCVAVDYHRTLWICWINTNPNHTHYGSTYFEHYELVSRCNITAG